ncbi:MAG: hypothetical protein ABIE55_03565 [Candidatus Aenigmatarchaeota archaeon]
MKGQTAIEYLMTYGWAILIILIVAGVLAWYGFFNPAASMPATKTGFSQLDVISPWDLSSADVLRFELENRVGQTINITDITVDEGTTLPASPTACTGFTPGTVAAGGRSGLQTLTCAGANTGSTGENYNVYLIVTYTAGSLTGLKSTGTLSGSLS